MATIALDQEEGGWVEWVPLEANENAFNTYIKALGISGVHCEEMWSFDEQIPFIPKPHYALILCYSNFTRVKDIMDNYYNALTPNIPDGVFFARQKIRNACGTFALIHALAQNANRITLGDGIFGKWLAGAKSLNVGDRSDSLADNAAFTEAHAKCAGTGATAITEADRNPDSHFICYVNVGGRLMEFDSRMEFPRNCGPTTVDSLLADAGDVCKTLLSVLPDIQFSALALVGDASGAEFSAESDISLPVK